MDIRVFFFVQILDVRHRSEMILNVKKGRRRFTHKEQGEAGIQGFAEAKVPPGIGIGIDKSAMNPDFYRKGYW